MTDQPQNDNATPQQTESEQPPAEAQTTGHMIPKSRFDEVNNKYKELQAQIESMQSAQQQAETERMEKERRFEELYKQAQSQLNEMQSVQTTAQRYQEALHATNQSRIEQIPEAKRHLVPDYDDPVKLGAWLDVALPDLIDTGKPKPPKLDGGSGGSGSTSDTPALPPQLDAMADIARQYGFSVDKNRIAERERFNRLNNTGE